MHLIKPEKQKKKIKKNIYPTRRQCKRGKLNILVSKARKKNKNKQCIKQKSKN